MLLPALSRAREAARSATCVNHERQMAIAMQLYLHGFGGWHPPCFTYLPNGHYDFTKSVFSQLGYLPGKDKVFSYDSPAAGFEIWKCPSEPYRGPNSWGSPAGTWYGAMYAFNSYMAGQPAAGTRIQRLVDKVRRPAEVYMVMDSSTAQAVSWTGSGIRPRHGKASAYDYTVANPGLLYPDLSINVGFFDGHIISMRYRDVDTAGNRNNYPWSGGIPYASAYCAGTYCGAFQ